MDAVLLFDGICGLCNRCVRLLIRLDRRRVLWFAPLQGSSAAALGERHGVLTEDLATIILVRRFGLADEVVFTRSEALIEAGRELGGLGLILLCLRAVPRGWRDAVYDWVARRRHRWFGQRERCPAVAPERRGRFLP